MTRFCVSRRTRSKKARTVFLSRTTNFTPAKLLLPVDAYFAGRPVLLLKPELEKKVRNGMTVILPQAPGLSGECRVYGESGEFLALGKLSGKKLETIKSFFTV